MPSTEEYFLRFLCHRAHSKQFRKCHTGKQRSARTSCNVDCSDYKIMRSFQSHERHGVGFVSTIDMPRAWHHLLAAESPIRVSQLEGSSTLGDQAQGTSQIPIDDHLTNVCACTANGLGLSSRNDAFVAHEHIARNSSLRGTGRHQHDRQPSPVIASRDSNRHRTTTSPWHSALGGRKRTGLPITCVDGKRVPARMATAFPCC